MIASGQMPPPALEAGTESEEYDSMYEYTNTSDYGYGLYGRSIVIDAPGIMVCFVCTLGLVGNGIIIWFLGFHFKRSPFTTCLLHLAVADFGTLIAAFGTALPQVAFPDVSVHLYTLFNELFSVTYTTGQFLLTLISIDRCVLICFPIWHRCHRPPHLSTIVCIFIWVFSFLICEIPFILKITLQLECCEFCFILNALLCLPLLSISTLTLLTKIDFKSQQHRWGKLLLAVSISLLFFLVFAFPFNVLYILNYLYNSAFHHLYNWGFLCTSINCSMNPVIYFLIGRRKRSLSRDSLKVMLNEVFNEKGTCGQELHPPLQMSALISP